MTTATKSETLASHTWTGSYGFTAESRVVRHAGRHYLIHDEWCGQGSIEGECYRPHVYAIRDEQLPDVLDSFARADEMIDSVCSEWDFFCTSEIPLLESMGRVGKLKWTANL